MVAKRKPLTAHQREVLGRLTALSGTTRHWVALHWIGSRTACEHLYRKGYVEVLIERGPRGGKLVSYRPVEKGERSAFASLDEQRA